MRSLLRRTPRKLPKVEAPISTQPRTRTGWLRWPFFHRLEPLKEERMKKTVVQRLKPVLNGARDTRNHRHKVPHDGGGHGTEIQMVVDSNSGLKRERDKNHESKDVKRRPRQTNHTKCNDKSTQRTKRMSYPPCDTKGLHEYLQRLSTKDVVPTRNPPHHQGTVPPRLSNAFSTSCPALYNPKVQSHKRFDGTRRHDVPKISHGGTTPHDQTKVGRNHHKGPVEAFADHHSAKIHRNHVKPKLKKNKHYSTRELAKPQRPKPPSWQDPTPPPSLTVVTEALEEESPTATAGEKDPSPSAKAESIAASSVFDTDTRSMNRRSALSRSHLKRTRSRVINTGEIPREDHVIPLSRTQQNEFHLKETHQDNHIYLTENAQRCRKWLSELEVEDLRDDDAAYGLTPFPERYKETVSLDVEVSHDRWNYLGSPYPSDSDSDAD